MINDTNIDFSNDKIRAVSYVQISEHEAAISIVGKNKKIELILNKEQLDELKELLRDKEIQDI